MSGNMKHDPISELRRYAADLEAEVPADRARSAARRALLSPTPRRRRPRRAVAAIAATALLGVSNVALASAADPAVPGDALYGVDRAYESIGSAVGLGDTHATERATEVLALQERGQSSEALQHVIASLTELLEAEDPVEAVEEFTSALDNSAVDLTALMDVVRDVDSTGLDVAQVARQIAASIELPEHARGNPGGANDAGPPGDDVGPPGDDVGPPPDRGRPDNPGNSDTNPGAGTPADAGQGGDRP